MAKESLHITELSQLSNTNKTVLYVFVADEAFGLLSIVSVYYEHLFDEYNPSKKLNNYRDALQRILTVVRAYWTETLLSLIKTSQTYYCS